MKPYRGKLLATAVLLAALPLAGCGDAETWKTTSEITLSAPASVGLNETLFTVVAPPPAVGYQCEMVLQYRAEGTGVNIQWANVPGTGTTRIWPIRPRGEGIMAVIARGKCSESREDWKYSNQVDVTYTAIAPPAVTGLTLAANPATVVKNNSVVFTLAAAKSDKCSLRLKYQYSGAGLGDPITTVSPAATGQFILTPTAVGTLVVTATAWCAENPTAEIMSTVNVTVTDVAPPTITVPNTPIPPVVDHNFPEIFTSGGAICSNGDTVQYIFTATGSPSGLVSWGGASVTLTWPQVPPAGPHVPYQATVSVQARCQNTPTVTSTVVTTASFTVN